MHSYRLACRKTIIYVLYILFLSQTTNQTALDERTVDYSSKHQVLTNSNGTLTGPVVVLISSDTVSIAQLPMILYGNVTDIYVLGNELQRDDIINEIEREDDDGYFGSRKMQREDGDDADAREREQMPHMMSVNTSTSLGKSEWQQIGVGAREAEGILEQAKRNGAQDETVTEAGDESHLGRRPRRSNSLKDHDDDSSVSRSSASTTGSGSTKEEENHTNSNENENDQQALEMAQKSRMQNVTSAAAVVVSLQADGIEQQQPKFASAGSGTPAEDDDKIGSFSASSSAQPASSWPTTSALRPGASSSKKVHFTDLDVHMALGYAFLTDSAGRIHRIKLPVVPKQTARKGSALRYSSKPSKSTAPTGESVAIVHDDTTNAISLEAKLELAPLQSKVVDERTNGSLSGVGESATTEAHRHGGSDASDYSNRIVDDANKSGLKQSNDVAHENTENESRHPVISGDQSEFAELSRSEASGASQPPVGRGLLTQGFKSRVENLEHDAKIIWSRSKIKRRAGSAVAEAKLNAVKQSARQQLVDGAGALPSREMSQTNGTLQTSAGRLPGANSGDETRFGSTASQVSSSETQSDQQQQDESHEMNIDMRPPIAMQTQVAVDWLNDLLFVLDRCRLFVMDFDGEKELTLIDDFNANNRPVDLKVDPVNSFLFWLQVGKFHNTIYKLDLDVLSMQRARQNGVINTLKLRYSTATNISSNTDDGVNYDASELVSLVSHHYAQPIITNLPRSMRMFTIDHKNSKIYVPIIPTTALSDSDGGSAGFGKHHDDTQSRRDDAEVFAQTDDITHLNNTQIDSSVPTSAADCHQNEMHPSEPQLLAYNLDGTDVGVLRAFEGKSHINKLDGIQDFSMNNEDGLLYLLMNDGRELFEEIKDQSSAVHPLGQTSYSKLMYVDNSNANQPIDRKSRFNVRRQVIDQFLSSLSSIRPVRSQNNELGPGSGELRNPETATRHAPYIILVITCLVVITIYLIYALIFERIQARQRRQTEANDHSGVESVSGSGSSIGADSNVDDNGFINSTTISRWVAGPSARGTGASTFERDINSFNERIGAYDLESSYGASNAVDEHYRGSKLRQIDEQAAHVPGSRLANLSEWPSNMHDLSNKLYVPVEVLQDEALSSIRRVTIEQLEIENWKAPLGEGHFGTVLQGTIDCSKYQIDSCQRIVIPCKAPISPDSLAPPSRSRMFAPSTSSSGHGSSASTSCEFATANTCTEPTTNQDDYLTPRNQSSSTASDYVVEMPAGSSQEESYCDTRDVTSFRTAAASLMGSKLRVAIKRLKDHASSEEKRDFLQEAKLLANFNHPNIVQLIGICLDRGSTLIVMELMLGGDLIRYMQENTPTRATNCAEELCYDDLLKICLDIANGCCYLEDLDYIHRDLAARNCLVSSRKREERVVKLADFGLARDIYKSSYYMMSKDKAMPMKWMAPECLTEQKFTKKSDVWSFGVVMWEVMSYCQEKPYVDVEPFFMKDHLATGARLKKPDCCDDSMYKLMTQCWQMEPEHRPTFHECRAMLIEIRSIGQL